MCHFHANYMSIHLLTNDAKNIENIDYCYNLELTAENTMIIVLITCLSHFFCKHSCSFGKL